MRKQGDREVFRISGARTGLTEDVRARQRRYVISMAIRTVSVILTVVLWNVERPLAWAMLVVGALLPYVAVVFANAGRENTPTMPTSTYVPPPIRRALEPTSVQSGAERTDEAVPVGAPAGSQEKTASGGAPQAEAEPDPQAEQGAPWTRPEAGSRVEQP
jgi:hypothetical protein